MRTTLFFAVLACVVAVAFAQTQITIDVQPGQAPSSTGAPAKCHPQCRWQCDDPTCPAQCHPVCERPKCQVHCEETPCAACKIHCDKPQCNVRCPKDLCESTDCPKCETVCAPAKCRTACTAPNAVCTPMCEETKCDWKCKKPTLCPRPKCELVCEAPACEWKKPMPPTYNITMYNVTGPTGAVATAVLGQTLGSNCCACTQLNIQTSMIQASEHMTANGLDLDEEALPSLLEISHQTKFNTQNGGQQCCACTQ